MITVDSELDHGSTFNVYLPFSDKSASREEAEDEGLIRGTETVLLVDDEEVISEVGQAMLEELGYRVIVCRSGQEAVDAVVKQREPIDIIILDLIMPGMNGEEAFDRIREVRPHIPVLLSSGYAINGQATKILKKGCNAFIQKPFNIYEFSQRVRKILDEAKQQDQ